jgi:hypothetical protein
LVQAMTAPELDTVDQVGVTVVKLVVWLMEV